MEVTTVSPSPASPTGGDDLCEIDVTNVAIHSVTLLISLCGLVGNGAVLRLLGLKHRNIDIYGLALIDFLFLLFTVPSALLFLVEDVSCSRIMPPRYLSALFPLSVVFCYYMLFFLTFRSNIVYMDKLYKLCCRCNLSKLWLLLVYGVKVIAIFTLLYFPAVTNLCPSDKQGHCRAALISTNVIIQLLWAAPVVIPSTIKFLNTKRGSHQQQPKRRDTLVFLMVLLILLLTLCNFLRQLGYTIVSSEVLFLLNCIQSSIKPFIYFLAGGFQRPCSLRSLRLSLQRLFDEQEEEMAHSNGAPMDTEV